MEKDYPIVPIGHVKSDFESKFGIPRQSGLVESLRAAIVFDPPYRVEDAVRGLEEYSHIWVLWRFSENLRSDWSPTVRPPRLGGNVRKGVFATRSPFRPNGIGLSCVRLERIEYTQDSGPVLHILGADMMDGTPVLDIKPYVPYADAHPEASGGFTDTTEKRMVKVEIPPELAGKIPADRLDALRGILENDPRPSYQDDPDRTYGFGFAGMEVRFRVAEGTLTVTEIAPSTKNKRKGKTQ